MTRPWFCYLVGGLQHVLWLSEFNWEFHDPNWRSPSFFTGVGIPPTNYPLVIWNSYWKWPFIVSFPIKNGDFPIFSIVMLVYWRVHVCSGNVSFYSQWDLDPSGPGRSSLAMPTLARWTISCPKPLKVRHDGRTGIWSTKRMVVVYGSFIDLQVEIYDEHIDELNDELMMNYEYHGLNCWGFTFLTILGRFDVVFLYGLVVPMSGSGSHSIAKRSICQFAPISLTGRWVASYTLLTLWLWLT